MPVRSSENYWILETDHTSYTLGLDSGGRLVNFYWGKRLIHATDYPTEQAGMNWASFNDAGQVAREEYPAETGLKYIEPCFKAQYADGVRDTVLRFEKFEQAGADLHIHLYDELEHLRIVLHYRVYEQYDLIERWVDIYNDGKTPITLQRVFSAQWHLPRMGEYHLTHLHGRWANEWNLCREKLGDGVKKLESRRLTTSHQTNPWFAVDGGADEDHGEVWFGALQWSGNWKFLAERTEYQDTRLSLGINDWDFAWRLNPAETFTTPAVVCGYTENGFGGASHHMHDFVRETILPDGKSIRKVLYNSWEATLFDVDESSQAELAELAAEMGVELFVLDDGWFHGRKDDLAGLGDWWPDETKFPNGLTPLIEKVNALGMDFGLWVEPEMVNPDSDLYRTHPEWAIHFPNRARSESRNQLILNFGRTEVQEYILEKLDKLLSDHNIRFIKWDMNRNISEPGWESAPGDPRELWVRYVQGVYRVWGLLKAKHPQVTWQSCSGGGGRADFGILKLANQVWVSDNTEPAARLNIQEGYSQLFPACTMEAWVTDSGPDYLPLEFRMHVSMCGALGIGGHILHWDADKREQAKYWISRYKQVRHVIQFGDLYRLRSPQKHPFSAVQYVNKDRKEAVLFAFRTHKPAVHSLELQPPLYLRGLDPDAMYEVEDYGVRSGLAWMNIGVDVYLSDYQSLMLTIRKVE